MKNLRTPRTLADSEFTTGYAQAHPRRSIHSRIDRIGSFLVYAGVLATISSIIYHTAGG